MKSYLMAYSDYYFLQLKNSCNHYLVYGPHASSHQELPLDLQYVSRIPIKMFTQRVFVICELKLRAQVCGADKNNVCQSSVSVSALSFIIMYSSCGYL